MALQEVLTRYGFEFDQGKFAAIERGVKRNVGGLNTIAAKTDQFQQRMGNFFARAQGVIGTYLGFRAIKTVTSDFANAADAAGKTAEGLGLTVEQYTALKFVAEDGGIAMTDLGNAMGKLSRRAAEANKGSKENQKVFKDMGISVKDANGQLKGSFELLLNVSDKFKSMKQGSAKTALALKLFEETGAKFVSTMNLGADGIQKLMLEAKRLGVVIDKDGAKKAAQYKAAMLRLSAVFKGIRNRIALQLIPAITKIANQFNKWAKEGNNLESALKKVRVAAKFAFAAVAAVVAVKTVKLWQKGVKTFLDITKALRLMGNAALFAQLKMLALVASVVFIGLVIEDLIVFARGGDSVIGRILGDSKLADNLRAALVNMADTAKKAWAELGPALAQGFAEAKPALEELGRTIKPLVGPAFRAGIQLLVISFKSLAVGIRIVADLTKIQIKSWSLFIQGANAVAKVLGFIAKSLRDITHAAATAAAALSAVTGRAKVGTALAGFEKLHKTALKVQETIGKTPSGGDVVPGLFRPQPAAAFAVQPRQGPLPAAFTGRAGGGAIPLNVNVNVASGAVQAPITGVSGPAEVAAALNAALPPALSKVFTDASRDIKPPPRGQR
jgi:inosine/xanthosine triphosphate pyrophosphatase family protein